jgi:hypothetical protein
VQVVAEILYDGEWRVTDANYFKNHVLLRDLDGRLPTLQWLREHPHHADCFPGGWIFPPEYLYNSAGLRVKGQFSLPFPEAENTWGADPYYCFYLGADEKYPPITPRALRIERASRGRVRITWKPSRSYTSKFIRYDLSVHRVRDGTLVASFETLRRLHADVAGLDPFETYSVSVRATDEHLLVEPKTWYPSTTSTFRLTSPRKPS